jgi:phosphotransferase system enzyme I (PtsI)
VAESASQLHELAERLRTDGHADEAEIMEAQAVMAADPSFLTSVHARISAGVPASLAVAQAADQFRAMFEGLDDAYLAARAADVQDVADRISRNIVGEGIPTLMRPSIVVASDLTPSQTASLDRSLLLGLATDRGSTTSHTAILARALGIPAVVGLGHLSTEVEDDVEVGLDGGTGVVVLRPTEAERATLAGIAVQVREEYSRLEALRDLPAETADGRRVTLAANIGSPSDLPAAIDAGAEGVGLFRTEFLFAERREAPTEDEQVAAYSTVLQRMAPHTVVIRTLDVGGDKPLPYLSQAAELNPFLGLRGVRYTLAYTDLFRTQLRALMRASKSGRLAVMVPMVATAGEVKAVQAMLREVQQEVGGDSDLGIMIEVPGAAVLAATFARQVAFLSVGTNDLVQYTLAVDRTNEHVASLYQPLHPAILRLLKVTVDGAHAAGKWAGVCGEMAGDPVAIPLLVGLGFDELSMTPGWIPPAKDRIRAVEFSACRRIVERALECETAEEVARLVSESL